MFNEFRNPARERSSGNWKHDSYSYDCVEQNIVNASFALSDTSLSGNLLVFDLVEFSKQQFLIKRNYQIKADGKVLTNETLLQNGSIAVFFGCQPWVGPRPTPKPTSKSTSISTPSPTTRPTTRPTTSPTTSPTKRPTTRPTTKPTQRPIQTPPLTLKPKPTTSTTTTSRTSLTVTPSHQMTPDDNGDYTTGDGNGAHFMSNISFVLLLSSLFSIIQIFNN